MGYELIWSLAQKQTLERYIELKYAGQEDLQAIAVEFFLEKFAADTTLYPSQWPPPDEPDVEEVWRGGGIRINYRRSPSRQTVEVLDVVGE